MNSADRLGWRDWLAGAALGAALGMVVLGVGGRLAMRGIALLAGQPPGFSVGGSATVVFLGIVWGLVGAVVFVGLRFLVRKRRFVRAGLFWAVLLIITIQALRPIDTRRLAVFVPLVILYGTALQFAWCRVYRRRRRRPARPSGPAPPPSNLAPATGLPAA